MEKKKLLIVAVVLVMVLGGAAVSYKLLSSNYLPEDGLNLALQNGQGEEDGGADEGASEPVIAPDFTVYDKEGNQVLLSDFYGTPVVVNFWASWCPPCKAEMPYFQDAYEQYGEEIAFLMVNVTDGSQETQVSAEGYIENEGYSFPVYYDLDLDASATYGIYSIPATLAVDAQGFVVTGYVGSLNEGQVELLMDVMRGVEVQTGDE